MHDFSQTIYIFSIVSIKDVIMSLWSLIIKVLDKTSNTSDVLLLLKLCANIYSWEIMLASSDLYVPLYSAQIFSHLPLDKMTISQTVI